MSAAPAKSADPSMDEILASIRRIIADDDETKTPAPAEPRPVALQGAAPAPVRTAPVAQDDDVLDLADEPGAARSVDASLEIETPELSFQTTELRPALAAEEPPPPPVRAPDAAPPRAAPVAAPPASRPAPDGIISPSATASVSHAFNLLSHTIMSQNAHTLEDVVREMLRPMLKAWLDDNLPPLVERLVAQEIQRVARGQR